VNLNIAVKPIALKSGQKNVLFNVLVHPDVPQKTSGDSLRLKQVIMNLANNAYKFTSQGEIRITVELKSLMETADEIIFSVKDTGIGIPEKNLERIFEPFFQGELSAEKKQPGTGLGLSICKSIIELMGGSINVKSEVGKGTDFTFTAVFNRCDEPAKTVVKETSQQQSVLDKNQTFLIVEDDEINLLYFKRVFDNNHLKYDVAVNGEEAVKAYQESNYSIIFMDCQMPVMDGYQATRKIRQIEGDGKHTVIIAVTAYAMGGDEIKCQQAGMDDYMSKPVSDEQLINAIAKWTN
jgi:CheY-like chemotaxis protein